MDNYIFLWHSFGRHLDGLTRVSTRSADWVRGACANAWDFCIGGCVSNWAEYDKGFGDIWNYKCYINTPGYLFP